MKRVLFLLIIVGAGVGAYMYFTREAATENGPVEPTQPRDIPKPAYAAKFESRDYAGALKDLESLLAKDAAAEGPTGLYMAARSALELDKKQFAETGASNIIKCQRANIFAVLFIIDSGCSLFCQGCNRGQNHAYCDDT